MRKGGWIGFFAAMTVLAAVAVVLPYLYTESQQLRREQLAAAGARWAAHGPRDYDLSFTVQLDRDRVPGRYVVCVRDGRAVVAAFEGELCVVSPPLAALIGLPAGGQRSGDALTVHDLFARLEALLAERDAAGRKDYLIAVFDPTDGSPRRFIRRVPRSSIREEWNVRVWPPGELARRAGR